MQLVGLLKLDAFKRMHGFSRATGRVAIGSRGSELEWPARDQRRRYPSASFLAENRVIFNIKGNTYRMVVKAKYQNGIVLIEWIGTHAEYDKQDFKGGASDLSRGKEEYHEAAGSSHQDPA